MTAPFSLHQTANALESRIRANRLLDIPAAWAQDEFIFPAYADLSIRNVPHSVAQVLGVPMADSAPLDAAVWGGAPPEGIDRVVMFLSDGLGYKLLNQWLAEDDHLRSLVSAVTEGRGAVPITSIAPSTTVVALPTLWTGEAAAAHGMTGTLMYLPEFNVIGNMIGFSPMPAKSAPGTLMQWGFRPKTFVPLPGLPEVLRRAGIPTHVLLERFYIGTGLSQILHRGVDHYHPHLSFRDMWLRMRDLLRATRGQRCYVNVYWSAVDALSHKYGAQTEFVYDEVIDEFTRLRDLLSDPTIADGRTLFLLLADHGQYDATQLINIRKDPHTEPLQNAIRGLVYGDARFTYVQVRDGHKQAVIDTIETYFADCLTYVDSQTALTAGLFGRHTHPEFGQRVGDLILLPRLGWAIDEPSISIELVSMHAGLTDWEMLVPFMWRVL